ncbi:MAG TPA: hypothetical protein VI278_11475 [Nitrososphaeraceae archaeon]
MGDYGSILKTRLDVIAVDDNKEMAKRRVQQTFKGMSEEQLNEFVIYGTPEDLSRYVELPEQIPIEYLMVGAS